MSIWILWLILVHISVLKSITGYHFPWENCPCCGEKYKGHKARL